MIGQMAYVRRRDRFEDADKVIPQIDMAPPQQAIIYLSFFFGLN
jgi:hypothetical protein